VSESLTSTVVSEQEAGLRLDVFVVRQEPALTRSQVEKLTKSKRVRVNGKAARAGHKLRVGDRVELELPASSGDEGPAPERVRLDILYEDEDLLVVNKPQGMVVHPGPGRASGTLVNALLGHTQVLAKGAGKHRPGIVHRLDRDTSGLMVVAKSDAAFAELSRQVRDRRLERHYLALVWGRVRQDRIVVDTPIGHHRKEWLRMAAVPQPQAGQRVRWAATDVRVLERLAQMTLVEALPATGRTHQIRVHLAHQGHPIVGDRTYGLRRARREQTALDIHTLSRVRALEGQALHAQSVRFRHPASGQELSFSVGPPETMAELLIHLRMGSEPGRRKSSQGKRWKRKQ
jgi:23S rRNA pseudouridine1911/1915/1917 synthase